MQDTTKTELGGKLIELNNDYTRKKRNFSQKSYNISPYNRKMKIKLNTKYYK